MERDHRDTTILENFYFNSRQSPFLRTLMPLFESNDGLPEPKRQVKSRDGIQLFWRQEQDNMHDFSHLSLTLARRTLALTVAVGCKNHSASTLVIEGNTHSLFEANSNAMPGNNYRGEEAILRFSPQLSASLAALRGNGTPQTNQEEQLAS